MMSHGNPLYDFPPADGCHTDDVITSAVDDSSDTVPTGSLEASVCRSDDRQVGPRQAAETGRPDDESPAAGSSSTSSTLRQRRCILESRPNNIGVDEFLTEVKKKRKNGRMKIELLALGGVAEELSLTTEVSQLPHNASKNASPDVLPYDHCRVKLPFDDRYRRHLAENDSSDHRQCSDYINACYVDSYTKPNAYIAAQGPLACTVPDFWRMIWNENVRCIVMATNLFEHAKQQCEKYWHTQHARFDDIDVWLHSVESNANLTVRTFRLSRQTHRSSADNSHPKSNHHRSKKLDVNIACCSSHQPHQPRRLSETMTESSRFVKQFQISSWGDDSANLVPVSRLLEFHRRIAAHVRDGGGDTTAMTTVTSPGHHGYHGRSAPDGPMLVHCGDGGGRTCVYIAIDAILEQAANHQLVDVFSCVIYLCSRRQNFIRTLAQYELIYEVVCMYLRCGETSANVLDFPLTVQRLANCVDRKTRINGFDKQFRLLKDVVRPLSVGECAGGHRAENRRKSRDIMMQPPERARPYLFTTDTTSDNSTDYINAVYVDGYHHTNAYVVTQWPLTETIGDIWRLVYDYNIQSIVVLNDDLPASKYPQFWPGELRTETQYGPLTVELLEHDDNPSIETRFFRIRKPRKYEVVMEDFLKCSRTCSGLPAQEINGSSRSSSRDGIRKLWNIGEVMTLISLQRVAANTGSDGIEYDPSATSSFERVVRMFQLKCWSPHADMSRRRRRRRTSPGGGVSSGNNTHSNGLESGTVSMADLLVQVKEWQRARSSTAPVCVMSSNGVSRCGVYCAVSISLDKLEAEGELDVFRAVLSVKPNRPQLVKNKLEYLCCYWYLVILLKSLHWVVPSGVLPSASSQFAQYYVDTPDDNDDEDVDDDPTRPSKLCWRGRRHKCRCRMSQRCAAERHIINDLLKQTRCRSADVLTALTVLTP